MTFEDPHVRSLRYRLEHGDAIEFAEARSAAHGFLKAWELQESLKHGQTEYRFLFENAEVTTPLPDHTARRARIYGVSLQVPSLQLHEYSPPPEDLEWNQDAENLWDRYRQFLKREKSLLDAAFFCFTYIERVIGGGRLAEAATRLNVSRNLLQKLAELSSSRGSYREARKIDKNSDLRPLTAKEKTWLTRCIGELVCRVAMKDPSKCKRFDLDDLPRL